MSLYPKYYEGLEFEFWLTVAAFVNLAFALMYAGWFFYRFF